MIGRVDDVANFKMEDLTPCVEYPFCLQSKMCWSKNVLDERDAPNQILLGAADPNFCVLLALAIHLEHQLGNGGIDLAADKRFLFGIKKGVAAKFFNDTVGMEDFVMLARGQLGTHSIRKFLSTHARRNGCSRDDVNARGRWKRAKQIVDSYIDVTLLYPDAKVAAVLCVGGPIKYTVRDGVSISADWIVQFVVPNIAIHFPRALAVVLGRALL